MSDNQVRVLELNIRNNVYRVSCMIHEECRLLALAKEFECVVNDIADSSKGKGSEILLFLLAALRLIDNNNDLRRELSEVQHENVRAVELSQSSLKTKKVLGDMTMYVIAKIERLLRSIAELLDREERCVTTSDDSNTKNLIESV